MSSLSSLVRMEFSRSEMSPIFSRASMTISSLDSSTCTSLSSKLVLTSLSFLSSGEVDISSPELDDDLILLFLKKLDNPSAMCC